MTDCSNTRPGPEALDFQRLTDKELRASLANLEAVEGAGDVELALAGAIRRELELRRRIRGCEERVSRIEEKVAELAERLAVAAARARG